MKDLFYHWNWFLINLTYFYFLSVVVKFDQLIFIWATTIVRQFDGRIRQWEHKELSVAKCDMLYLPLRRTLSTRLYVIDSLLMYWFLNFLFWDSNMRPVIQLLLNHFGHFWPWWNYRKSRSLYKPIFMFVKAKSAKRNSQIIT